MMRRAPADASIHAATGGSQFVPLGFGQKARDADMAFSMGSKGDAYDSAVAESVCATLEKEFVHPESWLTKRELIGEVSDPIEIR